MAKKVKKATRGAMFYNAETKIVEKLFNQKILSRPDVTPAEISKIAGVTGMQVYRWLKKFGFEVKQDFKNDKTPEEIGEIVAHTLSYQQFVDLYVWAVENRWSEKKVPEKRAYHLSDAGREARKESRKRTKADRADEQAKNAKLIAKAGFTTVDQVPVAKTAKAKKESLSEKLHDWVTTDQSSDKQVDNLLHSILFGKRPEGQTVTAEYELATSDPSFNAIQWAFVALYERSARVAQSDFMKAVQGLVESNELRGQAVRLLAAYEQNEKKIDLDKLPN